MSSKEFDRWRPHPWHGLSSGEDAPVLVQAYIEITPFDAVKYEVDKETGYMRVDRPQHTSSRPPALYGFIPRTYCAANTAKLTPGAKDGDRDPLDICVLSETVIERAEIVLDAHVVGGIQTLDRGAADDKIIAVLDNDEIWGQARDLADLPDQLVERLRHYFATYKITPDSETEVKIQKIYGSDHAHRVVNAAMKDYEEAYGT